MGLAVLAILALVILCAPTGSMARAVEAYGFREVRVSGFAWLGCGDDDLFRRKWSGRRGDGRPVDGVVCGGLAKGWTVRITSAG